ncbi:MAG: transcription-repair coupling factor [Firmicutes bacterium]|nr:transcription-repair coupling factor [Bacillota bacterium]
MEDLFRLSSRDIHFEQAVTALGSNDGQSLVYGITGTQKAVLLAAAYARTPRTMVVVSSGREALEHLHNDLQTLLPETVIIELPAQDIITFSVAAKSVELAAIRMDVLSRLVRGEKVIILMGAEAVSQKVLPKQNFINNRLTLVNAQQIAREQLLASLVRFGYERVDQVESRGQFSVRGGIIDIFAVNRTLPLRLELFGDEIDSLREFDVVNQRSRENLQHADVLPLTEPEAIGRQQSVLSYLPNGAVVVFDEPARVREQISKLVKENPELKRHIIGWSELVQVAYLHKIVYLSLMLQRIPGTELAEVISLSAKGVAPFHRQMDLLFDELKSWQSRDYHVVIFMSSKEKAAALQSNLAQEGVRAVFSEQFEEIAFGTVLVTVGFLNDGFEFPEAKFAVINERDIFGRQKRQRTSRGDRERQITYFRDINIGDYVVHLTHGIGKYVGVETLDVAGVHKDYLLIRYAGEDKLYVPTDQVQLLQKYIGAEGEVPRLHRMGGSDWLKVKTKAKAAATDLAKELITLYAERQITKGYAFPHDTPWQREFEDAFSFEETADQLTAVTEIKADMERDLPMDRLLCGDVGFGKTEVALRAAFKAIMSGKQVAVLVPTTVLAQQHYQTFTSRLEGFLPTVDVISRFRSPKEQREVSARVASGQVDVLIGTHRILNSDIVFKDLGLLIIDEEQRFGVAQKEKLKAWRANVDVLTLTATPIPRTLHMSLVGLRDMSIIETPPEDRLPVQTYVVEYREEIMCDAIRREVKRGGQVYFVYNRVQTIDRIAEHLAELMPDLKIKVAHGQMPEELLERSMVEFYEGHYDVLVCTSIIENGLDVPNANTIIVYDADRFGLSQLYQMRGRVGRSPRLAYAYFTYRQEKVLSEVAEKRLQAIKEFAELGAGFKIAMRDLEIRGTGNLLGPQQHGHIINVGFEMYCRLLDEAVEELRDGKSVSPPPEPVLELNIDAYLDGDYIGDAMHKIEIYQRIAAIRNEEHIREILDELIDRFGEPSGPVMNLLTVARYKNLMRQIGGRSLIQQKDYIEITFGEQPNVDLANLLKLKEKYPTRISIMPGPPQLIRLRTTNFAASLFMWIANVLAALAGQRSAG